MHYFVTGHTGFKGSWLILLLKALGHEVSGYSLPPVEDGLFKRAGLENDLNHHFIGDIRNLDALRDALEVAKPDFAIHMAAQPLVLRSYEDPLETYTTNVDGTLNFLRAITELIAQPISLVVTTDKVYRDDGRGSYVESDPLGGHDPYSASKAMADILTQSWAYTNPDLKLHIARAGNVIGAYDVSENRLLPDLIAAIKSRSKITVRNSSAIRPWQHVLDCLHGYILFLDKIAKSASAPIVLNFGPDPQSIRTVSDVISEARKTANFDIHEAPFEPSAPKETQFLTLDSSAAQSLLDWRNRVNFETAVSWTLLGASQTEPKFVCEAQIRDFLEKN